MTHHLAAEAEQALQGVTDLIGELGREVHYLIDGCETSGPVGEEVHTIDGNNLQRVSSVLDRIEALPFEEPGVILGPGAMLQTAIKHILTALSAEAAALKAQVAELTRQKQAIALDALAASGQAQEAYEAQLAAEAKVARLEGALTLAANRLQRRAVDYVPGSRLFIETSEWAQEARAALTEGDTTNG